MKPTFLSLISSQFTGMDNEDPCTHISTFDELIGTMGFEEEDLEHVYMLFFSFFIDKQSNDLSHTQIKF